MHSFHSHVLIVDNYHPLIELFIKFTNSSVCDHYKSPRVYHLKKNNSDEISLFLSNIDFEPSLNNNLSFEALIGKF